MLAIINVCIKFVFYKADICTCKYIMLCLLMSLDAEFSPLVITKSSSPSKCKLLINNFRCA